MGHEIYMKVLGKVQAETEAEGTELCNWRLMNPDRPPLARSLSLLGNLTST